MVNKRIVSAFIVACTITQCTSLDALAYQNVSEQIENIIEDESQRESIPQQVYEDILDLMYVDLEFYDLFPDIRYDKVKRTPFKLGNIKEYGEDGVVDKAIYNMLDDISEVYRSREGRKRTNYQRYYDGLREDIKTIITTIETVMVYTGSNHEEVDNFLRAYEMSLVTGESLSSCMIYCKNYNSYNIVYVNEIYNKYSEVIQVEEFKQAMKSDIVPYEYGVTSAETAMISAMSVIGKVRYVWGGGHFGASFISTINPVWEKWNQFYTDNGHEYSYIGSQQSWCPVHGEIEKLTEDEKQVLIDAGEEVKTNCISLDEVKDLQSYLDSRSDTLGYEELKSEKYKEFVDIEYLKERLSTGWPGENLCEHRLDGLDCSGYISWILNQMDSEKEYDGTSAYFDKVDGVEAVEFGSRLKTGDIFTWKTHVVMNVGAISKYSKAYVAVEQVPSCTRFCVIYYNGAASWEINTARSIANEANKLIGGKEFAINTYCMDEQGFYEEEAEVEEMDLENTVDTYEGEISGDSEDSDETETVEKQYREICRLSKQMEDSEIDNMYAKEIIEYVISRLPLSYMYGYEEYDGSLNKEIAATRVGIKEEKKC